MTDERAGLVKKELTEDEWKQHAEKLAELENERTRIEAKKTTHNREWNEQLKQLDVDIKAEAEAVETHTAWVPAQTGMFDEDGVVVANDDGEEAPKRGRRGRRGRGSEAAATA